MNDIAVSRGAVAFATSVTFSHTVATGDDRYIAVFCTCEGAAGATGVTYNGDALASRGEVANYFLDYDLEGYDLVAPDTGANNVVVSQAASGWIIGHAVSGTGVDQADPTENETSVGPGSATSISMTVTSATGDTVIGAGARGAFASAGTVTMSLGADQTSIGYDADNPANGFSGLISSYEDGASSVTHSYTISTSQNRGGLAWSVRSAAGGGGGGGGYYGALSLMGVG